MAAKDPTAALPSDAELPLEFADLPKMPSLPGEEKAVVGAPKSEATVDAKTEATGKAETVAKAEPVASAATILKDAAAGQTGLSDKSVAPPAPLASPGQGVAAAFGGSGGMGSTRISVPDAKPDAAPSPAAGTTLPVDVPTYEVGVAAAVGKPTVLGDRGRAVRAGVPGDVAPTVAQAGAVRTLEDTVVDLLRPMIRQWLDDNMPRMVEKALRIELASSVKSKLDQPKH